MIIAETENTLYRVHKVEINGEPMFVGEYCNFDEGKVAWSSEWTVPHTSSADLIAMMLDIDIEVISANQTVQKIRRGNREQ